MEMSEIYNGSQWAHDIFLVNKAGATEYITGRLYYRKFVQLYSQNIASLVVNSASSGLCDGFVYEHH